MSSPNAFVSRAAAADISLYAQQMLAFCTLVGVQSTAILLYKLCQVNCPVLLFEHKYGIFYDSV
eukprot:6201979-Pleurochrysis_carterae.AAC.3